MTHGFTICALGFGEYAAQIGRCLRSLTAHLPSPLVQEVRVALNAPTEETWRIVERALDDMPVDNTVLTTSKNNRGKYPAMRDLLYTRGPIKTSYVMWFDDDSWIQTQEPLFFEHCAALAAGADLVGAPYRQAFLPGQREWIVQQPWYRGRPFNNKAAFFQGAWWIARTEALRSIDYPWPELFHNGGDVMLGVAAVQNNWRTRTTRRGVAINADDAGNESCGPRRGLSTKPIGT